MSLTVTFANALSKSSRAKGSDYAAQNRVRITAITSHAISATVRGTRLYYVEIERHDRASGVTVAAECSCPYYADQRVACKHIWATFVVADEHHAFEDLSRATNMDQNDADRVRPQWSRPKVPPKPPPVPPSPAELFLSQLDGGLAQIAEEVPAPFRYAHGELLYVLESAQPQVNGVHVTTVWRTKKKTGEWGALKPASVGALDVEAAPDPDRTILAALIGARQEYGGWGGYGGGPWQTQTASFVLAKPIAEQILPLMARTGRLVIRPVEISDAVVSLIWDDGDPWRFEIAVAPAGKGYRVSGVFSRADDRLPLDEVHRLVARSFLVARGALARLSLPRMEDALLIGTLAGRGTIEVGESDATRLAGALARAGVPGDLLPRDLRFTEVDIAPVPHLHLKTVHHYGINPRLEASVRFDYNGILVPDDGRAVHSDAASRRLIRRHAEAERAAVARLTEVGLRASFEYQTRRNVLWIAPNNLPRAVRALAAEGWRVEAEGRLWRTPGQVRMSVTSGIDWLDLEATVEFGETPVDLPRLLAALQRGESFVRLDDGSVGMLPEDWLKRYAPLAATGTAEDGRLRFRPTQALMLDALLSSQADRAADCTIVTLDAGFTRIREELARFDRIAPLDAPASFRGVLRPYQNDALGWFHFLRRFDFGGCLADDMGLGKTIMVLALLAWRREEFLRTGDGHRTSTIVVPRSLVANWMSEAAQFAPDLRVVDYSIAGRGHHTEAMEDADVLIVTYGTLRRDVISLKDARFEYVILDEAQAIKNAASASAKAVRLLSGRYRLALSGTPIENHLGELWSLFEFLNPGVLGMSSFFQRTTAKVAPDPETTALLSRGLRPFFLRRTKSEVAPDLPARTEQTIHCELDKQGRALYDGLRRHYRDVLLKRIDRVGMGKSGIQVLEAMLRLRQAACHPSLIDGSNRADGSAKFEVLLPRLRELAAEGHKALVFSQFTTLLGLLAQQLEAEDMPYEYLDGQTRDRAERVQRFQTSADTKIFLISLKAGGVGLNLTAADYVFLLDPWWNPAVEAQAIDRTHRIGQTREVFAYRIIAKDTVEEKVLELQQSKRALADAVLGESATGLRHLQRSDLELLLS